MGIAFIWSSVREGILRKRYEEEEEAW